MKFSLKLTGLGLLFLGGNLLSMESQRFVPLDKMNIVVKNNLYRRIQVTWSSKYGTEFSRVVLPGQLEDTIDRLGKLSKVVFSVYGEAMQFTSQSKEVTQQGLIEEIGKLRPAPGASLLITVSQTMGSPYLTLSYEAYTPSKEKVKSDNPVSEFPLLSYYPELAKFTQEDIMAFGKWDTLVIEGAQFTGIGRTTAEDVYRYILNLPKQYNWTQVDQAYSAISEKWDPAKHPERKEYAERVKKIARKAYEEIMKKLAKELEV
jgi:hypothetical protein